MKLAGSSVMLAGALLLMAGVVSAAEPTLAAVRPAAGAGAAEAAGNNALRATLQSKLELVRQLLAQSPVMQRIAQSNSAPAKKQLAEAQALNARAQAETNAGRAGAAIALLDDALRQIAAASRLVPDVAQQTVQDRSRNADLRAAVTTFQSLQKVLTSRMVPKKGQTSIINADIGQIDAMVHQADALIASSRTQEANVVLNNAYKMVVSTLNNMLAAQTIVYDLKFDSPAEEFRHEMARNDSYDELIPIALAQLHTTRETATLAQRYLQQSRQLRAAAQRQASGGDFAAAMKSIQDATGQLQRALRVAGVVVPQSIEFQP